VLQSAPTALDRPSWLPAGVSMPDSLPGRPQAEPAPIPTGIAPDAAVGQATPPTQAPSSAQPQVQIPENNTSAWVQQTYQAQPAASNRNRYIAGVGALLVLLVAGGTAFVYQQSNAGPVQDTTDYAHLSAPALLSHAKAQVKDAGSYHLLGNAGTVIQEITVSGQNGASFDIKTPGGTISMMLAGGYQFLKAPALFYADKNPVLANNAADQWIIVPAKESLIPLTSVMNLDKTSQCMLGRPGTLTKVGPQTIDGKAVIEVDDKGEIPGGTPAHFYFLRDGGTLMGIDIVGASTAGGVDPSCDGGLGLLTPSFTVVDKLRFDHWGSAADPRMPEAIDLTSKPWCGTIIGSGLSAAVQQFLVASYVINQKLAAIEKNCGCASPVWQIFSQSVTDQANAMDAMANSVAAISFGGATQADAGAFVAAQRAEVAVMRRGLANGPSGWQPVQAERAADDHAVAVTITKLRADLGLASGTCNFLVA
jgi:hypothetical protein